MYKQGSEDRRGEQLATALGWFSLALGATELIAPRSLARAVGIPDVNTSTIRAFGVREVASGLAILARPDRPGLVWSRVGGNAIDISYLTSAFSSPEADRGRVGVALAAILGVTALDVLCAQHLSADGRVEYDPNRPEALYLRGRRDRRGATVHVEDVATINKPVDEVYRSGRTSRASRGSCATSNRCRCWGMDARAGARRRLPVRPSNGTPRSSRIARAS